MAHPARTVRLLALVATGSLALAACGGDDTAAPAASSSAPSSSSSSAPSSEAAANPGDGILTIGSLLPETGNLATLGPPEFAGVDLAIKEINDAGGVLDKPVVYIKGDSGDAQQDVANPTVDRLLAAKVDAIIGAASSGVTKTVIDKITRAGVIQYSPANTSPDFTTINDRGLYFRTAPSDVLQGRVLGETVVADGAQNVGILVLQDPYGQGLAKNVGDAVTANGASLAPAEPVFYDPAASNFDAQLGQIRAGNPDAIVLIGFEESGKLIQGLIAQGIGPQDVPLYLVDGNLSNTIGDGLPAGVLEGTKGSLPGAPAAQEFRQRLLTVNPALTDYSYSGESYDAVITTAIAAIVAKSDSGADVAKALPDVTRGGEKCTTFAQCLPLAEAGTDLDYDGVSGPIEFSDVGDPTEATIGIYTYTADNKYDPTAGDYQAGSLD